MRLLGTALNSRKESGPETAFRKQMPGGHKPFKQGKCT